MKQICAIFLIISSFNLYANEKYSMRSCMILPISDDIGSSLAFKVFDNLEGYLKSAGWCDYKSSADVLGIFSKYRNNLEAYLEDENVIRTVADRLKVGSLIRVKLKLEVDKVNIHLTIIGENGSDIYFDEKTAMIPLAPFVLYSNHERIPKRVLFVKESISWDPGDSNCRFISIDYGVMKRQNPSYHNDAQFFDLLMEASFA